MWTPPRPPQYPTRSVLNLYLLPSLGDLLIWSLICSVPNPDEMTALKYALKSVGASWSNQRKESPSITRHPPSTPYWSLRHLLWNRTNTNAWWILATWYTYNWNDEMSAGKIPYLTNWPGIDVLLLLCFTSMARSYTSKPSNNQWTYYFQMYIYLYIVRVRTEVVSCYFSMSLVLLGAVVVLWVG